MLKSSIVSLLFSLEVREEILLLVNSQILLSFLMRGWDFGRHSLVMIIFLRAYGKYSCLWASEVGYGSVWSSNTRYLCIVVMQLSRIIYLFSSNMHDASLSLGIHTTCARLMLNLVSGQT